MYRMIDTAAQIDLNDDSFVVAEPHPDYPGELLFRSPDQPTFLSTYSDWVSRYGCLNDLYNLRGFLEVLDQDGIRHYFTRPCAPILADYDRWSQPVHIEGFGLTPYPFQGFGLNRALERSQGQTERFYFAGWGCGSGKTILAAAGSQELINRGEVDIVLAFTLQKLKRNLCRFYLDHTRLSAVVVDGTAQRRQKMYADPDTQVFVLNYDKAWADLEPIKELVSTRSVLFVADEAHVLITDGRKNRSRKAFEEILKSSYKSSVWPMSATVVNHSPIRYRDVFNLGGSRKNPLGSKIDFENRYAESKRRVTIQTRNGGSFDTVFYDWDLSKLQEIRHRVSDRTQNVRKTDPALRDNFKGLQVIMVPVQMSKEDRRIYDAVVDEARMAQGREESLAPYYRLLRYVCNNPLSLTKTEDALGQRIAKEYGCTDRNCSKMELFLDQVEALQDSEEQVVVFTQWTNLSLFLISDRLSQRKIKHVKHYGVGQSPKESQLAQDTFKNDPGCTVFLSSDAGAYGLNFQNARYVISYEAPYSYDVLHQRNSRIDRADSHLDGLTAYVYVTEDSVEERIWEILNSRKELAAATTGGKEVLSYGNEMSSSSLDFLIFGS